MTRRPKTWQKKTYKWLNVHRKVSIIIIAVLLLLAYWSVHSYRGWADTRRLHASRSAIDVAYANISHKLGQPDNLNALNQCNQGTSLGRSYLNCQVETDFIYGAANENQANILLGQIQKIIAKSPGFKAIKKLSPRLSDILGVDGYVRDATDYYRGPYGSACQVKYSFASPDEINLSINDPSLSPFEIFFSCSHRSVKAVYPIS